jgi:hypothetical protein
MNYIKTVFYLLVGLSWVACQHNPLKINIAAIKEEVPVVRFENDIFALGPHPDSLQIESLYNKHTLFARRFFHQIVHMGTPSDSAGLELVKMFLNDSVILDSKKKAEQLFPADADFQKKLVRAFKIYRYYFPEKLLPSIYTCISGFNESVFTAGDIIGISLDKYLGADCKFYPMLGITKYKQRRMIPEMIPTDVIYTWGKTEFPLSRDATTLLDNMVYEGELLCFCKTLLPDMADTLLTGFTARQLKWCMMNEVQMWNYMIENKLLFSTKQMDIVRYINDGPMTNGFPPESPARTGVWLGWQIVSAYMKKHPEVTLEQLMADSNYQQILNASGYAP